MITRRVALFVLVAASSWAFVLAASNAALRLTVDPDVVGIVAVAAGLLVVAGVLWLRTDPRSGHLPLIGAFALPLLSVFVAAPVAALLTILADFTRGAEPGIVVACVCAAAVSGIFLWRALHPLRVILAVVLAACGLIVFVPLPVVLIDSPLGGIALGLSLDTAIGAGFLCAVVAGAWAAAMHPVARLDGRAEQAHPADGVGFEQQGSGAVHR